MFSTNVDTRMDYVPGDPVLIRNIVSQLKSQGVFDQFRKECISDVDTKPAYQNLCHRVDGRVESYLSDVKWGPDLNRNQLRENIRKHVNECTFVDSGISRIVDQLVNPRINTVLVPKVEDIVYSYLGIKRPNNDEHHLNGSVPEKNNVFSANRVGGNEERDLHVKSESDNITLSNLRAEPPSNKDIASEFKDGIKELHNSGPTNPNSINACSDIESDEDDMSPPFEPHEKSDVDISAESDYSMDIPDAKCDGKSEPSAAVKLDTDCDKIFRNLERICGEESRDSATSSCTDKAMSRKPSLSLDLPNTPTINYETSDESQDDYFRKNNLVNLRRESVQTEVCAPDTCSMDSFAEKVPEDDRESPNNSVENACSAIKMGSKEEKEQADLHAQKKSESHIGDTKDPKRNEKHSDRKNEHRKSDKQENSRSEEGRRSGKDKDKDRSNHENRNRTSKEKQNRDRKDSKDVDKNKNHEKTVKDRDSKHRESSKSSSSGDKNRSSSNRVKSNDTKDDRKKKSSSSKHDSEKDRERSKPRKEESSDGKKSKTQCNTDHTKMRTDRRSSDRDSTGPSSSSRSSSHRSSSKADKEKHRHSSSSSSSSSHKSKKNVETKDSGRAEDALYDSMVSVTGSALALCEPSPMAKVSSIENTSSLLDILNNDVSKTSRLNIVANCVENSEPTSSTEIKEARREKDESAKKREPKKKIDHSQPGKSSLKSISSRKNSAPDDETANVNISDLESKKPKIAKNAADILRIIELRKQYREKMRTDQLSQQQGKENTNSEVRKESPVNETDQKSILGERSIDNCVMKRTDKSEKDADEIVSDPYSDCKLKIKRVDTHYRLVNGSCVVDQVQPVVNNNDVNVTDNNAENWNENTNIDKYLKQNAQLPSTRVNGLLKDCPNLKTSIFDVGNASNEKERNCDTIGMRRFAITKTCLMEEIDDIRYFEPAELNVDFKNFVAKRIKESEEIYLENFSIHLKYSERYDHIFRNQLGAIVRRKGVKSETQSSPFKYNSEIIDNKVGNEKGIMMRIKKTVPENEMYPPPFGVSYVDHLPEETLGEISGTSVINTSNKCLIKGASAKKKTLGVKRPLSNALKVTNNTSTKILKLGHNHDVNGMVSAENLRLVIPDSKAIGNQYVEDESYKSLNGNQMSCNSTLDSQKGTVANTNSVHPFGSSTPKIQKPISKEQKRKQFYYDANDLYKPRPSFLVSSRRSRGLNPDKT